MGGKDIRIWIGKQGYSTNKCYFDSRCFGLRYNIFYIYESNRRYNQNNWYCISHSSHIQFQPIVILCHNW